MREWGMFLGRISRLRPFVKAKWARVPRAGVDVLVYDSIGLDVLETLLSGYSFELLSIRGERLFVVPALRALRRWVLLGEGFRSRYEDSVVEMARPKVILSMADNNPNFHRLCHRNQQVPSIAVQNGVRGRLGDLFGSAPPGEKQVISHFCVLGTGVVSEFGRFVVADFHFTGSLKANSFDWGLENPAGPVVFVSQFRPGGPDDVFVRGINGEEITYREFYSCERRVLPVIADWCEKRGRQLVVACASAMADEATFFRNILPGRHLELGVKSSWRSSYDLVNRSGIAVSIDSTLGLEALAYGKRVALFPCRSSIYRDESGDFLWPARFPSDGPFWASETTESNITRVLDYVDEVESDTWSDVTKTAREVGCSRDPGSMILKGLLSSSIGR